MAKEMLAGYPVEVNDKIVLSIDLTADGGASLHYYGEDAAEIAADLQSINGESIECDGDFMHITFGPEWDNDLDDATNDAAHDAAWDAARAEIEAAGYDWEEV